MTHTKRRLERFAFYEFSDIQTHLETMAAGGWLLERISGLFWRYRAIEPTALHFAVAYFPNASDFDPGPTEGQQTFQDYCAQAGWQHAASWGQMQIFYTDAADPVPLETDAVTQVETIHRAMKRNFLPSTAAMAALAVLQLAFSLWRLWTDPVGTLATVSPLLLFPAWLLVLAESVGSMLFYRRWHRRAQVMAETDGALPSVGSHRRLRLILVILAMAPLTLYLCSSRLELLSAAGGLCIFGLVFLLTGSAKNALKGLRASRKVNRAVTLGVCIVSSIALTVGGAVLIFQGIGRGWFQSRPPAEEYTYGGHTWEIYHDAIPLRLEDLADMPPYDGWSTERRETASPLVAEIEYAQSPRLDAPKDLSYLRYTVVDVHAAWLYELCLWDVLTGPARRSPETPEEYRDRTVPQDAAPWGAAAVYRRYTGADAQNAYVLCWPGRIVELRLESAPTAAQMSAAGQALRPVE